MKSWKCKKWMGTCAKSIRNDLSKGNMICSEQTSCTIYEMGNMELSELKQTLATTQCSSCLKQVPEGLIMCQCGVWLRPNQSTMDRIRTAFAALKIPYYRSLQEVRKVVTTHGNRIMPKPWMHEEEQRKTAAKLPMADRRDLPSFSIGAPLD